MGIYKEKDRLRRQEALLENSPINETNKTYIKEFKSYLTANRIGTLRIIRYMLDLRLVNERFKDKDYSLWTSKDVIEVLEKIENQDLKDHTKNEYRKSLRKFFKWKMKKDWEGFEHLAGDKKIDTKPDILSKDEVLKLIDNTKHPRDKAIVALLYEGGLRIGELASITIKDLQFNKFGGKVKVRGKTGERLIPFVISESYIKNWLQMHPDPYENNLLFVGIGSKKLGQPILYEMYNKILRTSVKNADIRKRVTPHTLRHTRATHLASKLTESEMCQYLGWRMGSDMPRVYVHLSGRDIDNAIYNKVYGLETEEEKEDEKIMPSICPRCKEKCGPTSEYCFRCGMPLDEDKILLMEKEGKNTMDKFLEVSKINPQMLEEFKKMLELVETINANPKMREDMENLLLKK